METILGLRLVFMKLKGVTSDGVVKHRVGNVRKAVESTGAEKPIILYCFIYEQALCSNSLEISEVMTAVIKTVNYIHPHTQKHSQF